MRKKRKVVGDVFEKRLGGIVEWICPHGVGHPLVSSIHEVASRSKHSFETLSIHGCDGCCRKKAYRDADRRWKESKEESR